MKNLVFFILAFALLLGMVAAQGDLEARVKTLEKKVAGMDIDTGMAGNPEDFRVYWKDGLRFETADNAFKLKIGGRMHLDYVAFLTKDADTREPALPFPPPYKTLIENEPRHRLLFRRARIYLAGEIYKNVGFKFQYDFANGGSTLNGDGADFKDVYMELKKIPGVGHLRVGQFKEPYSLEELTSSNYITFMERSLANVFAPARSTGFMLWNTFVDNNVWAALGLFKDSNQFGDGDNAGKSNNWVFTARVSGTPVYMDKGQTVLHLGLSGTHRNFDLVDNVNNIAIAQRPEIRTRSSIVNTGAFRADNVQGLAGEIATVVGPFSAQAEYFWTRVKPDVAGQTSVTYPAWYVEASFFVTGEHRKYDQKNGCFGRITPKKNFGEDGGFGAVQLAARFSQLKLDEGWIGIRAAAGTGRRRHSRTIVPTCRQRGGNHRRVGLLMRSVGSWGHARQRNVP